MSTMQGGPAAPPREPTDVLAGYLSRMRRQRLRYAIVLAVIVVLVVALVEIVLRNGESAHAHLHTAKSPVAAPPAPQPGTTQTLAWSSPDKLAAGVPVDGGIVVTYSEHTVAGRNYATGAVVWSYTRTDASICEVIQEQHNTIAFFDHAGNCDEASEFATSTGARGWYRTLDSAGTSIDGAPPPINAINGRPAYAASQYTILMATPAFVQAIDPGGGLDRWVFVEPSGCTTTTVALGSTGVLIGEHCADGNYLVLRDPYAGSDSTSKSTSIKWRVKTNVIPLSADDLISAFDPATGMLVRYEATDGKVLSTTAMTPAPRLPGAVSAFSNSSAELIWAAGTAYSINASTGAQLWSAPSAAAPSLLGSNPITVSPPGIAELDGASGQTVSTYGIATPPAGSGAFAIGSGFAVGGASTAVYH